MPDDCTSRGCGHEACCSAATCRAIAELIYQSMTACRARDRRTALHRLSDRYDCCCHPEVLQALVYGLNDCDEHVRAKAADEIGDQIRRSRCTCSTAVICALQYSLADCDAAVRRQAEEALLLCGYRIVDGCCQTPCCGAFCPAESSEPASAVRQPVPAQPAVLTPPQSIESVVPEPAGQPSPPASESSEPVPAGELPVPPATSSVTIPAAPEPPTSGSTPAIAAPEPPYFPSRLRQQYVSP
ncbi:MAG: hypothetical protein RIK87_25685 [Fuerstiella sp.]